MKQNKKVLYLKSNGELPSKDTINKPIKRLDRTEVPFKYRKTWQKVLFVLAAVLLFILAAIVLSIVGFILGFYLGILMFI